jgi:hypothetical protein
LGKIHDTIRDFGVETARRRAHSKAERCGVEAAAAALAAENGSVEVAYGSYAVAALPHKNPAHRGSASEWRQALDGVEYHFTGGAYPDGGPIGVPYGSKSRLIMLYLQTECVRSKSRVIGLDSSLYTHMKAINASPPSGGMSYRMFVEHARRVSACALGTISDGGAARASSPIVTGVVRADAGNSLGDLLHQRRRKDEGYLHDPHEHNFPTYTVLSEQFVESFMLNPIRLWAPALALLGNNSAALDIYLWLCGKLPQLGQATFVSWQELQLWFGSGYRQTRQMKPAFLDALWLALAVYPEASVQRTPDGVVLHPSPDPVARISSPQTTPGTTGRKVAGYSS